jgi:hypothetical protein
VRPIAVTAAVGSRTPTLTSLAEPVPDPADIEAPSITLGRCGYIGPALYPPDSLSRQRDMADMPYRIIILASPSKLSSLSLTRNKSSLPSLAQLLHGILDPAARQHGRHVSSAHHGSGRTHHNPRFGGLALRTECRGRGAVTEPPSSPPKGLA